LNGALQEVGITFEGREHSGKKFVYHYIVIENISSTAATHRVFAVSEPI